MIRDFLMVGLGGALGSMLRYGVSMVMICCSLPAIAGTFSVNIIGSFALGLIMACCRKESFYLFAAIGLCGGFTTFSTFSAQTIELFQEHRYGMGVAYSLLSLLVCLAFTALGLYLGAKVIK